MSLASPISPNKDSKSSFLKTLSFRKLLIPPIQLTLFHVDRPFRISTFKKKASKTLIRLNSSAKDNFGGGTRLIRSIQGIRSKIIARFEEVRYNLPQKLFSFLVGFYCATAFATLIGQTGDWDVLSATVAVAVVEGIGALVYRASSSPLPLPLDELKVFFNYWKLGLSLGLFLDSFKF